MSQSAMANVRHAITTASRENLTQESTDTGANTLQGVDDSVKVKYQM